MVRDLCVRDLVSQPSVHMSNRPDKIANNLRNSGNNSSSGAVRQCPWSQILSDLGLAAR